MDQTCVMEILVEAYKRLGVPADQLPYTDEFETLYTDVIGRTDASLSRAEFWRAVANARKRGVLPRLVR